MRVGTVTESEVPGSSSVGRTCSAVKSRHVVVLGRRCAGCGIGVAVDRYCEEK